MGILKETEVIQKYLGVPYLLHGRTMQGLDCWGLIKLVYADMGHELIDIDDNYDEKWALNGKNYFAENYCTQWERVEQPQLFDVLLFSNSLCVLNHAGICLSDNRFIHTCKAGTIISDLWTWRRKFDSAYRLKANDNCQVCTEHT